MRISDWSSDVCSSDLLPVLGICGGQQLLNVVLGGTLIQHIPDEVQNALAHEQSNPRHEAGHDVDLAADSLLRAICRTAGMAVYSSHNQAVKQAGAGVMAHALAPDGRVEGIEATGYSSRLARQRNPESTIAPSQQHTCRALPTHAPSTNTNT